jgi:hypothetical protein
LIHQSLEHRSPSKSSCLGPTRLVRTVSNLIRRLHCGLDSLAQGSVVGCNQHRLEWPKMRFQTYLSYKEGLSECISSHLDSADTSRLLLPLIATSMKDAVAIIGALQPIATLAFKAVNACRSFTVSSRNVSSSGQYSESFRATTENEFNRVLSGTLRRLMYSP